VPAETPAPQRVTTERLAALVSTFAARWGLTGRAAPAVDWTFTVQVVPGLKDPRSGGDAWALVVPKVNHSENDFPGGSAHVRVRDIDATPIPGFDGDPMREIRVTVAHELGHAVVAEALAKTGGQLTIPAEEQIVEAAAQALVRSEGTPDARVMARAVREAVPSALRARIAARAPLARGGEMDPKMIMEALEALIGGDAEKCQEILKGLIAQAAGAGAGPASDARPDGGGDAAPPGDGAPAAKVAPAPAPGGADGGLSTPQDDARRAKGAEMDKDMARARSARDELEAMATAARPAAKEALVVGLRARLGAALKPASEARIMAAPTFQRAQEVAQTIEETLADVAVPTRARSGIETAGNPGAAQPSKLPTMEELRAEGMNESWLKGFQAEARKGPDFAQAFIDAGRASPRARVANPNGGA
jgi:hypothetical protein